MSIVIAYKKGDTVYMGADSKRSQGDFTTPLDSKYEKKIHKIVHISKINTLAKEGEKVGSYFEIFKIFADIHKDLI
jgi:ATP-dependent protease HslVU (ClpYQ) peptidase subunit